MRPGAFGIRLHGLFLLATNVSLVDDFAENLRKSPYIASVSEPLRTVNDTGTTWDFDYEIEVELKQGIAAQ